MEELICSSTHPLGHNRAFNGKTLHFYYVLGNFLSAFAKLRVANNRFISLFLRTSVRMEQLGPQERDFQEISYFSIFLKYVEKPPSSIKIGLEWHVLYMKTNIHF